MSEEKVLDKYREQLDIAWAEFQNNNLDKAESICNALIIEFPDDSETHCLLGHIYSNQEKLAKALEQYSIALEKDKDQKEGGHINYWIGQLYDSYSISGQKNPIYDPDKAKMHYHKAKEYNNYPSDVINKLHYEHRNDYERIKLYEEGISKFPDEITFYIQLSWTYKRLNNPDKEIKTLNDVLAKGLKSASLYYNIGEFYYNHNQFPKCREYFAEAINLNEHYPNSNYAINYAIANSFFEEGDFINAETYYKKSFEESRNNDTCWFGFFGLIVVYNEQKKLQDIQKLINEIMIDKDIFFEEGMFGGGPFWLDSQIPESINLRHDIKKILAIFKSVKFSEKNDTFLGKLWLVRALLAKESGNHTGRYNALKNVLKYLSVSQYEFLYTELCSIYSDLIYQKSEKKTGFKCHNKII
jgi:tetratricopeptide (TPR) repeat protein